MPHVIEPAATGRAKCRACKSAIEKQTFRLGEEVENPYGDGTATHWYHLKCGALRRPEAFLAAVQASSALTSEDAQSAEGGTAQTELAKGAEALSPETVAALIEAAELGKVYYRLPRFVAAEVASSGRARCQGCRELIEKGALRFVLMRIEDGMVSGAGFVHIGCAHAYAGAVDGIRERVSAQSSLEASAWEEVDQALAEQATLERRVPEPRGGKESPDTAQE